jgi:hypothetical protein
MQRFLVGLDREGGDDGGLARFLPPPPDFDRFGGLGGRYGDPRRADDRQD